MELSIRIEEQNRSFELKAIKRDRPRIKQFQGNFCLREVEDYAFISVVEIKEGH